jgi:hypothetical protein
MDLEPAIGLIPLQEPPVGVMREPGLLRALLAGA